MEEAALPNLPCPKICKIIGEILKDHSLHGDLTLSAPTSIIYMQQFWYTVRMAEDEKVVMRFKIYQQEVDLTLDTFRIVLQLPQETTQKPFMQPAAFLTIEQFLKIAVNQSSYKAIEYPHYVKLIIHHVLETYATIPKHLNEPYCNLKDDDPILMMFTTGNSMNAAAMRIPDEFLIEEIKKTEAYKDYGADYNGAEVPMTQSSLVVSTQETHRALSTPRIPKPKRTPQKKKEKSAKEAEEKENVASVEKAIIAEEVDKMVDKKEEEEEEESFVYSLLLSQEDPNTRLEPRSYMESPKEVKDDDDDDPNTDDALSWRKRMGSSETREAERQTLIHIPPKSPRIDLSSDKDPSIDLTETHIHMSNVLSQSSSKRAKHIMVIQQVAQGTRQVVKAHLRIDVNLEMKKEVTSVITLQPSSSAYIPDLQQQLYMKMNDNLHSQANIDEDEVISEEASLEFLGELKSFSEKKVPTISNHHRMEATLKDMMRYQFKTAEEYAYHIEQATNYIEN
ncbi:hypothetical protein Tco_0636328 [Tanacetum coccineum]